MVDKDPEVRVPTAGNVHYRHTVAEAAVCHHEEHVAVAGGQFEGDFRVVSRMFTPRVAQQAERIARVMRP